MPALTPSVTATEEHEPMGQERDYWIASFAN